MVATSSRETGDTMWDGGVRSGMTDTEAAPREAALEAFLEGIAFGRGTTDLKPVTRRAAATRFDRWWERNHADRE